MINNLSEKDLSEIKYLARQGNGRYSLICNLYRLTKKELYKLLRNEA